MKGNKLHKGISTAAGFLFVIGVILCVICALCMSRGFFKYEYEKNGTAAYLDISDSDLERATEHWLAYIEDSEDDLDISVTLSGEERQLFNDREKEHMVDVKNLYLGALTVGRICAALAVIILLLEIFVFKRLRQAVSGYLIGNAVFFAAFAVLAVLAASDFTTFWTNFHHVFFSNDLWLLNPETDMMIRMVPETFFFDLVMRVVFICGGSMLVVLSAAVLLRFRLARKEKLSAINHE